MASPPDVSSSQNASRSGAPGKRQEAPMNAIDPPLMVRRQTRVVGEDGGRRVTAKPAHKSIVNPMVAEVIGACPRVQPGGSARRAARRRSGGRDGCEMPLQIAADPLQYRGVGLRQGEAFAGNRLECRDIDAGRF